jgi:hypothetical protein
MMNYYTPVTVPLTLMRKKNMVGMTSPSSFSTPIPGLLFYFPHAPRIDDGISYISEGASLRGMKDLHATQQFFTFTSEVYLQKIKIRQHGWLSRCGR